MDECVWMMLLRHLIRNHITLLTGYFSKSDPVGAVGLTMLIVPLQRRSTSSGRASGKIPNEYTLTRGGGNNIDNWKFCFIDTPGNSFLFGISGLEKG